MRYTFRSVISTSVLDLHWTGKPRSIGCALLRSGENIALIDPGPASTLGALRDQLALYGLAVSGLQSILLTHVHLDHAGAVGSLVGENPAIQVFVHRNGAAHMADPAKLLQSAHRLFGDEMESLFGEFLPVPPANLQILQGGETVSVGPDNLWVLHTPGHASHHVTYFDAASRTAFVGDTAGICIEGHPFVLPAAPPPDIELEEWAASLGAIEDLKPRRLLLTHFGFAENAGRHLGDFRKRLRYWGEIAGEAVRSGLDGAAAEQQFLDRVLKEAEPFLSPEEFRHAIYNGNPALSWLGLARYHRKRTAAPIS